MKHIICGVLVVSRLVPALAQDEDLLLALRMLLLDGEHKQLLSITDTLEVDDSLAARVYYYRGRAYQSLFNYDSAYHYYQLAHRVDSADLSYRVSMGGMLSRLGRVREGIAVYEDIIGHYPVADRHLVELAGLYARRNEHMKSGDIYKNLLKKDSLNYFYAKEAGRSFQEMNQSDSAIHYFEYAFTLNPQDVYLAHRLGNLYFLEGDLPTAILRVTTGMEYDYNNLDLLKLRGYLFLHAGQSSFAIIDLEDALSQDSMSVFTNKYLGMSYHEEKEYGKARLSLMRAFMLDSTDAETAFFLGNACRWSGFEEEGVGFFQKAIELRQPDPMKLKEVYLQLAELFRVLHRFEEAFDAYDMALECDPADNTIYFKIGQVYDRMLNQKKTAIEYYEKFLSAGNTGQQLFNAETGRSTDLEEHVRNRINRLKEELFFENQIP